MNIGLYKKIITINKFRKKFEESKDSSHFFNLFSFSLLL